MALFDSEFMKKLVYFPCFMRLRDKGSLLAVLAATSLTFLATWWLHAYQWFWLQESPAPQRLLPALPRC